MIVNRIRTVSAQIHSLKDPIQVSTLLSNCTSGTKRTDDAGSGVADIRGTLRIDIVWSPFSPGSRLGYRFDRAVI